MSAGTSHGREIQGKLADMRRDRERALPSPRSQAMDRCRDCEPIAMRHRDLAMSRANVSDADLPRQMNVFLFISMNSYLERWIHCGGGGGGGVSSFSSVFFFSQSPFSRFCKCPATRSSPRPHADFTVHN